MGAGGSVQNHDTAMTSFSNSKFEPQEFSVSLAASEGFKLLNELPPKFVLQINYESLDFIKVETKDPIIQFPFQNIICWGHNSFIFRFNVFDYENVGKSDISLILKTHQGKLIEDATMATVKKLMVDMEKNAIGKDEFNSLLSLILNDDMTILKDGWLKQISEYSRGRAFLAKQCMDLVTLISPVAPFEKCDLACLLYTRILKKDSFQLVINSLEDEVERSNLIHRLGLDKKGVNNPFVTDCKILPSISTPIPLTSG